jgi:hypothetical protein
MSILKLTEEPQQKLRLGQVFTQTFKENMKRRQRSPLVPCSGCQTEVSRVARVCPKCGQPNPGVAPWVIALLALVFMPVMLWWMNGFFESLHELGLRLKAL